MSRLVIICLGIVFFLVFSGNCWATLATNSNELISEYSTVSNEENAILFQTGLSIHVGDQYINEEDKLYEITLVEGAVAKAHDITPEPSVVLEETAITVQGGVDNAKPLIAIYHTHTDESYIPTNGTATMNGKGSIMLVGDALTKGLTSVGYQVIHDKTLHCPHDANAYQRSRRTFMKLLTHQPAALFDIHRDSAPLAMYKTTINHQDAVKILLVVGQQNQNKNTTLAYAKNIKSRADGKYKGLIRGIFIARGNYNQDLNPRSMLIEMGTQYNTLKAAQYSAVLFASVLPSFIPVPNSPSTWTEPKIPVLPLLPSVSVAPENPAAVINGTREDVTERASYADDIAFILSVLILGTIAYLYLSTGSWQEAKYKLHGFFTYEFKGFLGWRNKGKK